MRLRLLIGLPLLAILIASCEGDTTCRQDLRVRIGVQMVGDSLQQVQHIDTTTQDTTMVWEHTQFKSISGLQVQGLGSDSMIADGMSASSLLYLPLRKDRDTSTYIFRYRGQEDRLTVVYTREDMFVSLACGCSVNATLDTIFGTSNFLDSVLIHNSVVSTAKETHLTVYMHVPQ